MGAVSVAATAKGAPRWRAAGRFIRGSGGYDEATKKKEGIAHEEENSRCSGYL